MPKSRNQTILTHLTTWFIILFSFYNFSAWFYPEINPDMAVGILMSGGYYLPGDLYMWGQSHYGSIVPILANLLILTYHFPAALAFSVAHFAILTAGFFALSSLFKSGKIKILLALIWFFPAWHFHNQVISSAGIMLSFISIGIFFINKSLCSDILRNRLIALSVGCISFIIAVWTSDLAAFSLLVIFIMALFRLYPLYKGNHLEMIFKMKEIKFRIFLTVFWSLLGLGLITYAKVKAGNIDIPEYLSEGSSTVGVLIFFKNLFTGILEIILFKSGNIIESIYLWILTAGFIWLIILSHRRRNFLSFIRKNKWMLFFLVNIVAVFLYEVLAQQFSSGINDSIAFSVIFISAWIAFLLYIENTGSGTRGLRIGILYVIVVTGALSSISPFYLPHRAHSQINRLSELKEFGNIGIIAGYKNAYSLSALDPKTIHSTPHDSDLIRNPQLITDVFKQPHLYVIRDGWMNTFPDTLRQFGQILLKQGDEFLLGELSACKYERYLYRRAFRPGEMQFQGQMNADKDALAKNAVKIDTTFDKSKHFVFGPFIPLNQGKIKVIYRIKGSDNLSTNNAAVLEVSADYGKKILASRTIRWSDFQRKSYYESFDMIVEIPKNYKGVEFRIMYLGGHELWFDQVEMTGM